MKKSMKKSIMNALIAAMALGVLTGGGVADAAEKMAWLVYKLNIQRLRDSGDGEETRKRIMSEIPKGTVIDIPEGQAGLLCDLNKTIFAYEDKIGRKTATCVYIGYVRDLIE
jgi:hypothetical protein